MTILLWANAIMALASVVGALIALTRPEAMLGGIGPVTPAARFYARMYAIRAIPLGLAVAVLTWQNLDTADELRWWLLVAGTVQVGDALLGLRHRTWPMVGAAGTAAVVHLLGAALV